MKKNSIVILSIFVVSMIIVGINIYFTPNKDNPEIKQNNKEQFLIGNTLDDGRQISFTFDIPYKDNGLSYALSYNEISIDNFINKLNYVDALNDGGSKLYQYKKNKKIFGNDDFYVIVCNSLDGINNIYVAKKRETLDNKCSIKIDDLDGVSMSIKEGTLTNLGATILITDTSDRNNIYGEEYRIDRKDKNGNWVELEIIFEGNYGWNSIGYSVGEDNKLSFHIIWKSLYGELKSGEYRIVKSTTEAGEGTNHYITSEFTIK